MLAYCAGPRPIARPRPLRAARDQPEVPLGFSPASYVAEKRWEELYLALPDASRCGRFLRRLTARPHLAGTPADRRLAEFVYDEFKRDGLVPELVEYRVLLSYPRRVEAELVAPARVKLAHSEPALPRDKATRVSDPVMQMPWNAYSPSADLTAPVVYVNYGAEKDYEELDKLGVSAKGKIVLARYFHGYRGGKSLEAEKRGAAGVMVYSDPADDGRGKGKTYPEGPWGPPGHFQRGAVVYDFLIPGDPLTPGWASTDSAPRIPETEAKILPRIPMLPLSAWDAAEIISRLAGPEAPKEWQGGLGAPGALDPNPFAAPPVAAYRIGDGSTKVHLAIEMENRVTPIWDVIGKIHGSEEPEKLVVLSNHRDAWVYGAVDPSSGTATLLETARALGGLLKRGFRPRRTIVLGSWDAEEYTLTGSTEWGEQFEQELTKNAVVCLNVDAATSGQDFSLSAIPALVPAVAQAAAVVRDPATGRSVYDRWRQRRGFESVRSYAVAGATNLPATFSLLGGGSDYMVFLEHDGVPSLDMIFDGPYGVYHSVYDDYEWMERFGDPGFAYHAAMSRLWGLLALRFAGADLLPLDYSIYADEIAAYLAALKKTVPADFYSAELLPLVEKCREWRDEAAKLNNALSALREGDEGAGLASRARINASLMAEERALLDARGLPGRPWFRHLVYAPLPSYEAETLPGLREALLKKDLESAREQAKRLASAIDRATRAIREGVGALN